MPVMYVPDHHCGSRLRPSTAGVWNSEGHGVVVINSHGFRGPELFAPKPDHLFRIAVLGDSFIEAFQVDDADSFCRQLQQQLSRNSDPDFRRRTFEVINCGVSGYGTGQQLQMLKHHVLPLAPDAVLLAFYPENDIRNNLRSLERDEARPYFVPDRDGNLSLDDAFRTSTPYLTAESSYEQIKAEVVNRSRILQLLKHTRQYGFRPRLPVPPRDPEELLMKAIDEASYIYQESDIPDHHLAWTVTEQLLREISIVCREHQVPMVVFTVSTPAQVFPNSALRQRLLARFGIPDFFYAEHRLLRFCDDADIDFYPLASRLRSIVDDSGDVLHGFPSTQLGIGHWNSTGHRYAARLMAEWLTTSHRFRTALTPQ